MCDAYGAIRGVDRLAPRTGRPKNINSQVLIFDIDVNFLGLGKNRNRGCRGMNSKTVIIFLAFDF